MAENYYIYKTNTGTIVRFGNDTPVTREDEGCVYDDEGVGVTIKVAVGADNPVPYKVDVESDPPVITRV